MSFRTHRLRNPEFHAHPAGIDVEGTDGTGRRVLMHLFTGKGVDPVAAAIRLRTAATRTNDIVVSTSRSSGELDGASIDAVRSGGHDVYSTPSADFLPKRGVLASLAARLTGEDRLDRAKWRAVQAGVLDSARTVDDTPIRFESGMEDRPPHSGTDTRARGFGALPRQTDDEIAREFDEHMELLDNVRSINEWNGRHVSDLPYSLLKHDHGYAIVPALQRTVHPDYRSTVYGAPDSSGYPGRDENSEWSQTPHARILAVDEAGKAIVMTGGSNDYLGADWHDVSITTEKDAYTMIDALRAETMETPRPGLEAPRAERSGGIMTQAGSMDGLERPSMAKGPSDGIDFADPAMRSLTDGHSRD